MSDFILPITATTPEEIPYILRKRRDSFAIAIPQRELAQYLGTTEGHISRVERGVTPIDFTEFVAWTQFLNLRVLIDNDTVTFYEAEPKQVADRAEETIQEPVGEATPSASECCCPACSTCPAPIASVCAPRVQPSFQEPPLSKAPGFMDRFSSALERYFGI